MTDHEGPVILRRIREAYSDVVLAEADAGLACSAWADGWGEEVDSVITVIVVVAPLKRAFSMH